MGTFDAVLGRPTKIPFRPVAEADVAVCAAEGVGVGITVVAAGGLIGFSAVFGVGVAVDVPGLEVVVEPLDESCWLQAVLIQRVRNERKRNRLPIMMGTKITLWHFYVS